MGMEKYLNEYYIYQTLLIGLLTRIWKHFKDFFILDHGNKQQLTK